jgi:hypothetical protein
MPNRAKHYHRDEVMVMILRTMLARDIMYHSYVILQHLQA